jgi:hypothetical protein
MAHERDAASVAGKLVDRPAQRVETSGEQQDLIRPERCGCVTSKVEVALKGARTRQFRKLKAKFIVR